jgi:hypothetical protein
VGDGEQLIPRSYTVFYNCYVLAGKCASLGFQVVLGYGLDDAAFEYWKGQEIFLFSQMPRPPLGPSRPVSYYLIVAGVLSRCYSGRDMKLTTQLYVASALKMSGAIPPLYRMPF